MNIKQDYHYEIPPQALMSIFWDVDFFHARFQMAGVQDYEITQFGEKNGKFIVETKRHLHIRPPAKLPHSLHKFIKEKNTLVIHFAWDLRDTDVYTGIFFFKLEGLPGEITGTTSVRANGNGSVNQLNLTVKTSIPIFGKKIAEIVGEKVLLSLDKDYQSTQKYIEKFYKNQSDSLERLH